MYTLDMSDADGNLLSEADSRLAGVEGSGVIDYVNPPIVVCFKRL